MKYTFIIILLGVFSLFTFSLSIAQSPYSVRGLCIAAPEAQNVDSWCKFIEKDLAEDGLNTLILRVDYRYQFKSHPELVDENPLTEADVKKIVKVCRENGINLIPQINLLGHQSWDDRIGMLLKVYPQFDETPNVKLPAPGTYEWPNADGYYCKSYCPRHPDLHPIVFDLIDEICEAFESDAFHAGLDEVFYLGEKNCPRCAGRDQAQLFADEVTTLRNYLNLKNRKLWMWGDRLIDGRTTGIGLWEGSYNNTYRAIDMIPKDVVVCDWHYERADPTAFLFAAKGLQVLSCSWRKPQLAIAQHELMKTFKNNSTSEMNPKYLGMLHTCWGSAERFMASYTGKDTSNDRDKSADCLKKLTEVWQE
ncbi:family 20 glycosylhydrolase [Reichenbachiella sp.]|uniref:family 20 glycosylhydrolase n=1 Tax=Reichenbachiella sp. TaxID=2184521 RepID=UPI003BB1F8A8